MVFLPEAATTWFVYLAAGSADIKLDGQEQALAAGEALLLDVGAASERYVLTGGGDVVIVKLMRAIADDQG